MTLSFDIARAEAGAITSAMSEDIHSIVSRATAADGTAPISEQAVKAVSSGDDVVHLLVTDGANVVGYAGVTPPGDDNPAMAEVVVDPQFRNQGAGRALVERALAEGGPGSRVWAHGDLASARAVASRLELTVARELLQMRRPLASPELPDVTVPEGVSLRTYRGHQDDAELLRVNNAAFAWHPEQGGWTDKDIAERRAESWFDPAGVFLAFEEGSDTLLGFHWTKVHAADAESGEAEIGEVYVVGIDPAAQGRGLGRTLTLAGLHYLRGRELGDVLLYVEADNNAAVHTYERLGFTRFHVDVAYSRP